MLYKRYIISRHANSFYIDIYYLILKKKKTLKTDAHEGQGPKLYNPRSNSTKESIHIKANQKKATTPKTANTPFNNLR